MVEKLVVIKYYALYVTLLALLSTELCLASSLLMYWQRCMNLLCECIKIGTDILILEVLSFGTEYYVEKSKKGRNVSRQLLF